MKKKTTSYWNKLLSSNIAFCLAALILSTGGLFAQGWQQSIGSENPEEGWAILRDLDGGYLLLGAGVDPDGDFDQDIFLIKYDIDGVLEWSKYIDNGGEQLPRSIARLADNNLIIVGSIKEGSENEDVQLLKIDPQGNEIWNRTYGGDIREVANGVATIEDGGFVIVGENDAGAEAESDILVVRFDELGNARWQKTIGTDRSDVGNAIVNHLDGFALVGDSKNEVGFDNDIALYRLDSDGNIDWEVRLANNFLEEGRDLVATIDNGIAIAGLINDQADAFVAKFDEEGNQRWTRTLGDAQHEEIANGITQLPDGSLIIAGIKVETQGPNADFYLAKLNANGTPVWENSIGRPDYLDEARAITTSLNGGFAFIGYNGPGLSFENDIVLVKTDALGNTLTNQIKGSVYQDLDGLGDFDLDEPRLKNWIVVAQNGDQSYFGTTDEEGNYSITVDTGLYRVDIIPENRYWSKFRDNGYVANITEFYDTARVDLAAVAVIECPYLEIDISTPYLAQCDNVVYTVEYCNLGTSEAIDAQVEVLLDNQLSFLSSTVTAQQEEQKLFFDIGNLQAGECGSFEITTQSTCVGIARNQAVLVEASISPDTLCLEVDEDWDQSDLRVSGICSPTEATFKIVNVGIKKMALPQRTTVIEADIIMSTGSIQLEPAQDTSIKINFSEGRDPNSTYRVIVDQSPNHPFRTFATDFLEGCSEDGTNKSTGFVSLFPEDDQEPSRSKDIQEIIDLVPSVELRGYPKGYNNNNNIGIIAQKTDLTYKFILSNTGTNTVNRIVIRDTLSEHLDLSNLQMGASSHNYTYEVYGEGILKITFDDISLLPDGASDNPEVVFVEFKLPQLADLPEGTIIENKATIFFENQTPINSNIVQHQVGTYPDFIKVLVVDTKETLKSGVKLNVYPNPFVESVRFSINGTKTFGQLKFRILDLSGRLIDQKTYSGNQFDYYRSSLLSNGTYVFELEGDGQIIGSGKLLVQ